MSVQYTCLQKLNVSDEVTSFETKFSYPKLVIFENSQNLRILDLDCKNEEVIEKVLQDEVIVDKTLKDGLLWYIYKTGKINIVNLFNGKKMELVDERFKFIHMKVKDNELFLISESGEFLRLPYTSKEICEKMDTDESKLHVSLKEVNTHIDWKSNIEINGLQILIEEGGLKAKCPVTGVMENVTSNVNLDHVFSWDVITILSNKSNMWVVDFKDSNVIFEFGYKATVYCPVGIHNNILYYIVIDEKQVSF